jgi:PAS domain S-box-containing protein
LEKILAEHLAHAPVFLRRTSGEIVFWPLGAQDLYGYSSNEAVGRVSHDLLQTQFPEALVEIEVELARQGEWQGRLSHTAKDGRKIWTESLWRQRDARNDLVVEQNIDISDRVALEKHRDTLAMELDHRVKNTLAVIQGLARMSFSKADADHVRQFDERLIALSGAHKLLKREHWDHVSLKDLIQEVANSLGVAGKLVVDGPDARLKPSAAVSYALAFHELCTNALKHGALSVQDGQVSIVWSLDPDAEQHIHLVWRESGGPVVSSSNEEGFGSRLIRRAVARELGTPVVMWFEAEGLVCEFGGPVQKHPDLEETGGTP